MEVHIDYFLIITLYSARQSGKANLPARQIFHGLISQKYANISE